MPRTEYRRLVLILVAALAIGALALTIVRLLSGAWPSNGSAIAAPLGWTLPITTAFVIVGVAWLLMSQARGRGSDKEAGASDLPCPACGRTVLRDWRLCPYCAAVLDGDTAAEEGPRPAGA